MIETLREKRSNVQILIHTAMNEEDFSVKYLSAGADGFLSKSSPLDAISDAVIRTMRGEKYMSLKTQGLLATNYLKLMNSPPKTVETISITPRETEIINLLLEGKWTKEIASELGIKWSTVSTHKLSIFEKFNVTNIVQLYKKIARDNPELIDSDRLGGKLKS